jgi:NADPH:quinone reductase-like Zn-dependent oxidoreductase
MVSIYAAAYQSVKAAVSSDVASLRGKKVLVIGGMDGTGQAIIQISRKAHADVYCTAPEHRHGYVQSTMGAIPLP